MVYLQKGRLCSHKKEHENSVCTNTGPPPWHSKWKKLRCKMCMGCCYFFYKRGGRGVGSYASLLYMCSMSLEESMIKWCLWSSPRWALAETRGQNNFSYSMLWNVLNFAQYEDMKRTHFYKINHSDNNLEHINCNVLQLGSEEVRVDAVSSSIL